jgi:hypothetical protein
VTEGDQPQAFVVLDGARWRDELGAALDPFQTGVLDVAPWPTFSEPDVPARILNWLSTTYSHRPVLGLMSRALYDDEGYPQRGASRLGTGVAVVSAADLCTEAVKGVIRHELAHALGMPHCPDPACVLNERPWPLDPGERPSSFCVPCDRRWRSAARGPSK